MKTLIRQLNLLLALASAMLLFTVVAQASTYTVTNALDNGAGSLRQAITDANSHAGADLIIFNIPGSGVHQITLLSELPALTGVVDIDGYSQPGSHANTLSQGDDANLLIEINGGIAGPNAVGLTVFNPAAGSAFSGLVINRFRVGIYSAGGTASIFVEGCFIGTDPTGTIALANTNSGIKLDGSRSSRIGGPAPAQRNLISGNQTCLNGNCSGAGIAFIGSNSQEANLIQGNFIGTDRTSQLSLANSDGILVTGHHGLTIGGPSLAAKNVISGNQIGIRLLSSDATQIAGNYIGTNAPGINAVGNTVAGIQLEGTSVNNIIGGTTAAERNVISGNVTAGISVVSSGAGNAITGNIIGMNYLASQPLGNGGNGIEVKGGSVAIGGTQNGASNLITYNSNAGVYVSNSTGSSILGNSIYGNGGLGIDLVPLGSTPNDLNDVDGGPNNTQNFPVLTSVVSDATQTSITGTLNSTANSQFRIEFFLSTSCSGSASVQSFVGFANVTTVGNDATFTIPLQGAFVNQYLSATATDASGNTSEFSACKPVAPFVGPVMSINDVSKAEGNQGTTNFDFTVTLSAPAVLPVTVVYVTSPGSAVSGVDFQPVVDVLTFAPGQTSKPVTVHVIGDTQDEPDKTFFVELNTPVNATISKAIGTGTIVNDDGTGPPVFQFSSATYSVQEDLTGLNITVTRTGNVATAAAVDFATVDGSATQKSDFEINSGTLTFEVGDTSKSFRVLINEDMYLEGNEAFQVALSNPSGAQLGQQATALVTITDDLVESQTNPIDSASSFVQMHYHDFLNREPDQLGLQFWAKQITTCGQDTACIANKRINVSAAYFLSIEFQQTGYLLCLMQKESFSSLVKYKSFMRDLQEVSQGVVVNAPGWQQKLADNQQQFAQKWVSRATFRAAYDGLSNAAYVDALYANAGVVPSPAEHDGLVTALDTATKTRAAVLLDIASNATFRQQQQNSAFVLMQYFGYLRRDPDSGPDSDLSGYNFWLQKLNSFNGDYQQAEMVKAFLDSTEYRGRFGF